MQTPWERLMHPIQKIIKGTGITKQNGIYSVCSASNFVIEAALKRAKVTDSPVLIEATANQVNQFGGYTGMKAADFAKGVFSLAEKIGVERDQIILGGDHLGPYPWRDEDEDSAMEKAAELVSQFVSAGFTKIHLDTSMRLGSDDVNKELSDETIALRALKLAEVAANSKHDGLDYVFVMGSEVPIPGGATEEEAVSVTSPKVFVNTYKCFEDTFKKNGMDEIWQEVIAFVVQPGVEFGETDVTFYNRDRAKELCSKLKTFPNIVFEGHSTDYQPVSNLKEMVEDGIKILKVGPALTFHQREAMFALEMIEKELLDSSKTQLSEFSATLEEEMLKDPANWKNYYHGDEDFLKLMRKFSLSDRCRYYFTKDRVVESVNKLIRNLDNIDIPYSVLSQYMPIQADYVHSGVIKSDSRSIIESRISDCIDDYLTATGVIE
jgi:D-tagatose-1,6-bisphosphate aldolase subunit GatZ/KbaZ